MASKLVNHLVDIVHALESNPPVTQFHDKPITRLTYEEYINQELSTFRNIVTEHVQPLETKETKELNTKFIEGDDKLLPPQLVVED
jgi:hypothetical protein